ncbi:hypothetical protein SDC9_166016 [bioreactor metagenome]|uniref:Uncharacterized protein n=1 Tax=bioreactor metagenome TaxID=1076179 RepID=A0A645G3D6_9ZZZZ
MRDFLAEKQPRVLYGGYPPYPLVEGLEGDMFYEVDPVHLDQVGLRTELDGLRLLAPDYGADIVLVDTHDAARHRLTATVHLPLLGKHLPDDIAPLVVEPVQYKDAAVLTLDRIELSIKFFQQEDQGSTQFPSLLPGFPAAAGVVHVAFADIIIFAAGTAHLQLP